MKLRLVVSMVVLLTSVVWFGCSSSNAEKAGKSGATDLVDDFSNAAQSGHTINSNGRTWSTFGGIAIKLTDHSIVATGDLVVWGGFVSEPGPNGENGTPIPVAGKSKLSIVCEGKATRIKVEFYDKKGDLYAVWFNPKDKKATLDIKIPEAVKKGGVVSKLSFVMAPGKVDFTLYSITLK
ncbi:MAG: hypothetical protein HQK96_19325 [Nitrospirae bacterium]|nr:hypothetical protein [Nitrospirota bacterium]